MSADSSKMGNLSRPALEMIAEHFKALGDGTRLELLQHIYEGEKTVQQLSALTNSCQANVSKHLAMLSERGIIKKRKQKLFAYYSLSDPTVIELTEMVCASLSERFTKAQLEFQ